ncbi:putative disease resistance protein At4g10780 isoform X2 [Rhodamnia argentea]|uniref:Disease resistance protein At4g10780 isoform X2 n=1 Tax=Rhodamnia argentea TaxID=178133 RepID=A0A8B8Q789_9MYRT|nr:putative disease resistance protein At4g10780 isoform X2 [Rhodamnia argentea]
MPRELDPFRRHVEVVGNKWKCRFCGKDFGGSATRIRAHLAGFPGYGIQPCERVDDHVRSQASKAMKGKSVADATNRGGPSIELMGQGSVGTGLIAVLGNSNHNLPQQPSCHWQNGNVAGAASVDCQYQESLCLADGPVGDLSDENGNGTTSSLQQPSTDPPALIFLDPSQLPELFDQFIDLETRYEQQNSRGPSPLQNRRSLNNSVTNGLHQLTRPGVAAPGPRPSDISTIGTPQHPDQTHSRFNEQWRGESASCPQIYSAEWMSYLLDMPYQPRYSIPSCYSEGMQMSDLQNQTFQSSSETDQSLHVGTSNCLQECNQIPIAEAVPLSNAASVTNAIHHSCQQPLLICDEDCGNETGSFPSQTSMDISPPSASQPSTDPHTFEELDVDFQVPDGGTDTEGPLSSQASRHLPSQSLPDQPLNLETTNTEHNPRVSSSSLNNQFLITCFPQAPMDIDASSPSSSEAICRGVPITSHPNTGNFENNGALKRKVERLYNREADIKNELEFAASLSLKKQRIEVVTWLMNVEKLRKNFQCLEPASAENLPPQQQVDMLMKEAEDLIIKSKFPEGLFEVGDGKVNMLLERKLEAGKAFQINTKKILQCLTENHISRLGIYGMGGVGKTTIMVHVHNWLLKNTNHINVLWIAVSQDLNIHKLQGDIWKALKEGDLDEEDAMKRAAKLFDKLIEKGKSVQFVLILDDVWEHFDLDEVGIPVEADGPKLVLTTRSFEVCRQMHCQEKIKIEPLSPNEAQSLFLKELGPEEALSLEVGAVMKLIVEECAGLPLGIVTMARTMRGVSDLFEWKDILERLKESNMGQMDMEKKVLANLKLSYNRLSNREVQQCFLCCALYPQDQLIHKFELIEFFIDQGLIGGLDKREKQYDRGLTILNKLENVCLLENDRGMVKMHDLIRDMALHVMSVTSIVKAGKGLKRILSEECWMDDVEKVSFMKNDIGVIPSNMSPNCPKLATLIFNDSLWGDVLIPESFFKRLKGLKVLNLSGCGIRKLPNSISDLVNLRALLFRECRELCRIPYLGKLSSLRKLDVHGCRYLKAVEGLELLVNLTYLDLSKSGIERLVEGTLAGLVNLQYLKLGEVNGGGVTKLWALETLDLSFQNVLDFNKYMRFLQQSGPRHYYQLVVNHKKSLWSAFVYVDPRFGTSERKIDIDCCDNAIVRAGGESNEDSILIAQDVQRLVGRKCGGMTNLSNIGPLESLKVLIMEEWENLQTLCGGVDEVTDNPDYPLLFPSLKMLTVERCPKLKYLFGNHSKVTLPHLRQIVIKNCDELQGITAAGAAFATPLPAFPSLEKIVIERCANMKSVVESELLPHLPNLREVTVQHCEKMEEIIGRAPQTIPLGALSLLTSLWIERCPSLRKLLTHELLCHLPNLHGIVVHDCKRMEEIIGREGQWQQLGDEVCCLNTSNTRSSLPKLKFLNLITLPELGSIYDGTINCDSIQYIRLWDCPKLKRIPLHLPIPNNGFPSLREISVDDDASWESLEWGPPHVKSMLRPFVHF